MNERRLALVTATAFLLLGGASIHLGRLPLMPAGAALVLVTALFLAMTQTFQAALRAQGSGDDAGGGASAWPRLRAIALILCFAVVAGLVFATGGVTSPFRSLLFLPILLSTLAYGMAGGVWMGVLVSLGLAGMALTGPTLLTKAASEPGVQSPFVANVLLPIVLFNLVAVAVGSFAESLKRAADESARLARTSVELARRSDAFARVEHERAAENEAILETASMMEAMEDLESTLAVALLRLSDIVPADTYAIFLRDPEPNARHLHLALLSGVPGDQVTVRSLPLAELDAGNDWRRLDAALLFGVEAGAPDLRGALCGLDPHAHTALIAPLRTFLPRAALSASEADLPSPLPSEDFIGLIYVGENKGGERVLTDRDRERLEQVARRMVYPIQQKRLQAQAFTDVMTGLENHRRFRMRLEEEVRRAYRYGHPISLLLLDIDHFKRANDTYGHLGGDALLRQIGALLRRSVRSFDVPARYGGEEMAVILPETSAHDAALLAERIRRGVEESRFSLPDSPDAGVRLTVSLGVATLPDDAAGDAALIERADEALYRAKRGGRNAVRVAGEAEPLLVVGGF